MWALRIYVLMLNGNGTETVEGDDAKEHEAECVMASALVSALKAVFVSV
jgi:hypothetical protein